MTLATLPSHSAWFAMALALVGLASTPLAEAANKCLVNGTVTYQQGPCPAEVLRPPPTAQQLNAEHKRRRAAAASAAEAASGVAFSPAAMPRPTAAAPSPVTSARFSCDGRRYCSQMRSCEEAKYFLAHCPGVKMDGNHDGTPCEQQWCGH